ncbi:MAG TPA: sulfotransferase domain-containing protein, partial [Methylomirabilota bacterium]
MIAALRRALQRQLPRTRLSRPPGRSRGRLPEVIYADDTFLVSYPRSGSAWLRRLIAAIQDPTREIDVAHIEQWVPDIYAAGAGLEQRARPRIMKSHERFDEAYPRVVYLVRDGRDVAVSYYNLSRTLNGFEGSFDDFLMQFLSGKGLQFGSWSSHVESWLSRPPGPAFLLVRYEDLHRDVMSTLGRVAGHLGWRPAREPVLRATEVCRFENHRDDIRRIGRLAARGYEGGVRGGPGAWSSFFTPTQLEL